MTHHEIDLTRIQIVKCDVGARCGSLLVPGLRHGSECSSDRTHTVYEDPFTDFTLFEGSRRVRGLARSVSDANQDLRQNRIPFSKDLTRILGIVETPAEDILDLVGLPCFADSKRS